MFQLEHSDEVEDPVSHNWATCNINFRLRCDNAPLTPLPSSPCLCLLQTRRNRHSGLVGNLLLLMPDKVAGPILTVKKVVEDPVD